MRARWIKPEFFRDVKIGALGPTVAVVYIALWCAADDYGTAPCTPKKLQGELFWSWSAVGVPEITGALQALTELGRIVPYVVGDETFCRIVNWAKHQRVHKPSDFTYPTAGEPLTSWSAETPGTSAKSFPTPRILDTYNPRHLDTKTPNSAQPSVSPPDKPVTEPDSAIATPELAPTPPPRRRKLKPTTHAAGGSNGKGKGPPPNWLSPIGSAWDAAVGPGTFPYATAWGHLKRLVATNGEEMVITTLQEYLLRTRTKFRSVPDFVAHYAEYMVEPLFDEQNRPTDAAYRWGDSI